MYLLSLYELFLVPAHSGYIRHETFSFMMSLPSFGDRFCFSNKGGIGGGGWVHLQCANSMAMSGLVSRNDLVGTGRATSVLFGINGVRNKQSHLVGSPFPAFKAHFSARHLLIGGCGQSTYLLRMAEITSGSSFELNNPTEQKLGYIRILESENDLEKKIRTIKSQYHIRVLQCTNMPNRAVPV